MIATEKFMSVFVFLPWLSFGVEITSFGIEFVYGKDGVPGTITSLLIFHDRCLQWSVSCFKVCAAPILPGSGKTTAG